MSSAGPRLSTIPEGDPVRARAAFGIAAAVGVQLGVAQRLWLEATLRRSGGRWSAFESVLIKPRQNGKTVDLLILALTGALVMDEDLVIVTAHEWRTVVELFRVCCSFVLDSPLRRYLRHIRRAGGEEAIEFTNGNRIRFLNRSQESGRGFAVKRLIIDEAQTVSAAHMEALLPTLSAQIDPQIVYAAHGPQPSAWYLARIRQRVLNGDTSRLCWVEYSADREGDTEAESVWLAANPAVGEPWCGLTVQRMREERASLGYEGFLAQRLAAAPWPSELDGAYGLFSPDDIKAVFGRS